MNNREKQDWFWLVLSAIILTFASVAFIDKENSKLIKKQNTGIKKTP